MNKFILLAFLSIPFISAHASIPDCAIDAAKEFNAPVDVFTALVVYEAEVKGHNSMNHGPMGLYENIIPVAAKGIQSTEDAIRNNSCENYRASAWLLMHYFGFKYESDDIWENINRYFYGHIERSAYPMTDRVKAIYDDIHRKDLEG